MILFIATIVVALAVPLFLERRLLPDKSLLLVVERQALTTWNDAIALAKGGFVFVVVVLVIWILIRLWS